MRRARAQAVPVRRQFWSMSIHFISVYYSATKNRKNSLKIPYFWAEGHLRLLMLIALKITLLVHVCAYLQASSH